MTKKISIDLRREAYHDIIICDVEKHGKPEEMVQVLEEIVLRLKDAFHLHEDEKEEI